MTNFRSQSYRCTKCNGEGRVPLSPVLCGTLKAFEHGWLPIKTILEWFPKVKRTAINQRVSKLIKLGLVERKVGNGDPVYRRTK